MHKLGTVASDRVIEILVEHGHKAYYVGGAVRDFVRGTASFDIDIATSATPVQIQSIFPRTVDVGIEFGTVLVLMDEEPFEVTTFRHDTSTEKRTLREDLKRRDFTMNALAYTIDGKLIDFFEGKNDIEAKQIRAVDNPEARITEDPLRILRACRFMSTFQYTIESVTKQAMINHREGLQQVAKERLKQELDKLFIGRNVQEALQFILSTDIGKTLPCFPVQLPLLSSMIPFRSASEGWAYIAIEGKTSANNLAKAYALSNEEKSFIQDVQEAHALRSIKPFTIDEIYRYSSAVLYFVEGWYAAQHGSSENYTMTYWQTQKANLPIQSKKDLVVTGKHLIEWATTKQGRWVGEWMTKIERAVLHEQLPNDEQVIKEWFIHEFNSER